MAKITVPAYNILGAIEKYGDLTKKQLIAENYDESGEGITKNELRAKTRGELLALLIEYEILWE